VSGFLKPRAPPHHQFRLRRPIDLAKKAFSSASPPLGCDSRSIWRDEVFGPVVCFRPFDDENQMAR